MEKKIKMQQQIQTHHPFAESSSILTKTKQNPHKNQNFDRLL